MDKKIDIDFLFYFTTITTCDVKIIPYNINKVFDSMFANLPDFHFMSSFSNESNITLNQVIQSLCLLNS